VPKPNKNEPPIRAGKWNPDAPLGYHWCDDYALPDILRDGEWEAGYVTINPAYRYSPGGKPNDGSPYAYNGLDRIKNAEGYTFENVVSCCYICNRAKSTMTQEEFLAWISRVHTHRIPLEYAHA
jgi:hypothetical protein